MPDIPRDLINALADQYPDVCNARALWQRAGGSVREVENNARPIDLWQELWRKSLQGAAAEPARLLQEALQDLPNNQILNNYLKLYSSNSFQAHEKTNFSFSKGTLKINGKEFPYKPFILLNRNVSRHEYLDFLAHSDESVFMGAPIELQWHSRKLFFQQQQLKSDDDIAGINYWEALAYSKWKKLRLPTLTEMRVAAFILEGKQNCEEINIITESAHRTATDSLNLQDEVWTSSVFPEYQNTNYVFGGNSDLRSCILYPVAQHKTVRRAVKIRCVQI